MKKIALIVDTVNWAFYNNANNIKKYLSEKYDVTIIPTSYLENSLFHLYLLLEDYDLVHFFWRYELYYDNNEALDWILKEDGLDKNRFLADKLNYDKITTGVYDHLFIDDNFEITKSIFSRVKNYTVSSSKLLEIYNNLDLKYKPTRVITDGVNLELFYPINLERFDFKKERKIVIGWVGNSKWSGNFDHKGLKTILDPAIDEIIPLETLKKSYNPEIVDSIKFNEEFNIKPFEEDKKKYLDLYISLCTKHFDIASETFLISTLGYWYPNVDYWTVITDVEKNNIGVNGHLESLNSVRKYTNALTTKVIPIYNIIWSIGSYILMIIISLIYSLKNNSKKSIILFIPIIGVWLTILIATPVFAEFRYMYSACTCLPFLMLVPFMNRKKS